MKKILLCDDDQVILNVLTFKIRKANVGEVVQAADGRQAKSLLETQNFDLIITDLHMPFHTGLEMVSFVRKELKKETPIIVLSAEGLENVVMEAFEIGADDFVTKPFNPEDLVKKVKDLL